MRRELREGRPGGNALASLAVLAAMANNFFLQAGFLAFFLWLAENFGTFAAAWVYPTQRAAWHVVPIDKMGAWYLLMLLSFALVSVVHRPEPAAGRG